MYQTLLLCAPLSDEGSGVVNVVVILLVQILLLVCADRHMHAHARTHTQFVMVADMFSILVGL
jgi:hypothetical protein